MMSTDLPVYTVRDCPVILDSDLAEIYGMGTKVFNQAFKRNIERFPSEFAFQTTDDEWLALRSQIVTSKRGGRRYNPWVFTEHGALMASMILNSDEAISMSVFVIRSFVETRKQRLANTTILKRFAEIYKTLMDHDRALWDIYQKLLPLLQPAEESPKRRLGFHDDDES